VYPPAALRLHFHATRDSVNLIVSGIPLPCEDRDFIKKKLDPRLLND
jgi:hypothetical protein